MRTQTVTSLSGKQKNDDQRFAAELDEEQRNQILIDWNKTESEFPKNRCIHHIFSEQATRTPTATALVLEGQRLSYGELDRRANQLAHDPRAQGVGPEVVVGLLLERSFEAMVAIVAVLKAGGAYLPLDPTYPPERIQFILEDAHVSAVLTAGATDQTEFPPGVRTISLDRRRELIAAQATTEPASGAIPGNLAYVMYTSGSSGRPKGIGVVHSNVNRLVKNTNYVQINSSDVFLQLSPLAFDASTFEIWGAFLNGAKLLLYPRDPLVDFTKLKSLIRQSEVSILWLTAGLFHSIVDADVDLLAPIRQLLVGGDVVSPSHVREVLDHNPTCCVINGYGPTEGTTFSICYRVPNADAVAAACRSACRSPTQPLTY